jgi:hypothetical protein
LVNGPSGNDLIELVYDFGILIKMHASLSKLFIFCFLMLLESSYTLTFDLDFSKYC